MVDHFADGTALTPKTDAHIPCVHSDSMYFRLKMWWLGARLSKAFAACKSTQASWDEHVNIFWIFLNILEISKHDFNIFLTRLKIRDEHLKDHHQRDFKSIFPQSWTSRQFSYVQLADDLQRYESTMNEFLSCCDLLLYLLTGWIRPCESHARGVRQEKMRQGLPWWT
jgi:hypothetical protein